MLFTIRGPRRKLAVLVGAAIAAASVVGVAGADDISNDLDSTVDAAAEVMPLSANGAAGSTQLYVIARNGDGKNGCNLIGGTSMTVAVASSNTAVATVSPSSITFRSCSDRPTLTVTPHNAGSATVSLTQSSNSTDGSFNLAPATFTVNVSPPPNTPPSVTVQGVTGGASYNKGSVPAATCQVTDAEDGNSSRAATLSAITGTYASDGIGQQTASCSYTDAGGLTAADSLTYNIVDPTPPAISYTLSPASPDDLNGWYRSNVNLTWTVQEPESPNSLQKIGCVDQSIVADQLLTSYTCEASSAGGAAGRETVSLKRDATAPVVNVTGVVDGRSYTLGSVPTAGCSTTDATSGVATHATLSSSGGPVGSITATCSGAKDNAGNTGSASVTYSVHYAFSGFFRPIDNGVLNVAKAGSAIPVKFSLAGDQGLAIFKTGSPSSQKINCDGNASQEVVEETVNAGASSLSYDGSIDQYNYVWKTDKAWAGSCRELTVALIDGSVPRKVQFRLTK